MTSTERPNVFVNDCGDVYSSPNANFLPAIPIPDCDIDNPRDTALPHWASDVRPELPFTPLEFDFSNYIIKRLELPSPVPVEQRPDGTWELHPHHQEKWFILEQSLQYIITKFRQTYHSLFSLNYRPYRNPSDHGYLRSHKEAKHARYSATQSQLAFLPFIGRVSYELSRVEAHVWPNALLTDVGQPVRQSWIDAMKTCAIANFSPSIRRAGILINLGSSNTDILMKVPRMLECNVPVWFFWGSHTSPRPLSGGPSIDRYCPNRHEIKEALIKRQITLNPNSTSNPIFPPIESFESFENFDLPPNVDPVPASSSTLPVSSLAHLT
jgi:hypothetical protein